MLDFENVLGGKRREKERQKKRRKQKTTRKVSQRASPQIHLVPHERLLKVAGPVFNHQKLSQFNGINTEKSSSVLYFHHSLPLKPKQGGHSQRDPRMLARIMQHILFHRRLCQMRIHASALLFSFEFLSLLLRLLGKKGRKKV